VLPNPDLLDIMELWRLEHNVRQRNAQRHAHVHCRIVCMLGDVPWRFLVHRQQLLHWKSRWLLDLMGRMVCFLHLSDRFGQPLSLVLRALRRHALPGFQHRYDRHLYRRNLLRRASGMEPVDFVVPVVHHVRQRRSHANPRVLVPRRA